MPEAGVVDIIDAHALELANDHVADVVLRAVLDVWPFPPHQRVVPEVVAALNLSDSVSTTLAELGRARFD